MLWLWQGELSATLCYSHRDTQVTLGSLLSAKQEPALLGAFLCTQAPSSSIHPWLSRGGHLHHLEPFSSSSSASALQNLTAPQAEPEEDVGFLQVLQGVARVILHRPKGDEHLPAATHGSQSSVQPGKASGGLMRWLPFNVTAVISFVLLR